MAVHEFVQVAATWGMLAGGLGLKIKILGGRSGGYSASSLENVRVVSSNNCRLVLFVRCPFFNLPTRKVLWYLSCRVLEFYENF